MTAPKELKAKLQTLQEENKRLRQAVEELSLLIDLAREIGSSLNSQDIMKKVIHMSLRAVHAEQGLIALVEPQKDKLAKTLVRSMVSSGDHRPLHLHQSLLGWMHINKKPLMVNDPENDERFHGVKWDETIHSFLCVPLMVRSELRGVLTVYNKKGKGGFTIENQRLLAIIAAQSAQIVENARLYEEEQALLRMKQEIKFASEIQLGLLPKKSPQIPGYDIAGVSIPAQMVGGDYFDFIPVDENKLALCLGDVSGKGLPAALLMANLQATIRGQTLVKSSPKECLLRSNKLLYRSTDPQKFATVFYGILDAQTHQVCYSNAGHNRPIFFSDSKEPTILEEAGIALSFLEEFSYDEGIISFNPGDILVIYSDGITEAMDAGDEEFGEDRLLELISQNLNESAAGLVDKIITTVNRHAGERHQMDDMTLVVIKREKKTHVCRVGSVEDGARKRNRRTSSDE